MGWVLPVVVDILWVESPHLSKDIQCVPLLVLMTAFRDQASSGMLTFRYWSPLWFRYQMPETSLELGATKYKSSFMITFLVIHVLDYTMCLPV